MSNTNRERLGLLTVMCPQIFREPGTVLYVGAHSRRFWGSGALVKAGNTLTVLEIWKPFLEALMASRFKGRVTNAILGDVTKLSTVTFPSRTFDHICWFHGPEHVEKEAGVAALKELWKMTRGTLVASCPWGQFRHGVAHNNPYTVHKSHWYPEDLKPLKMRYATIGPKDRPGGQLQAWRTRK